MATDKRELILGVKVDDKATKPLKDIGGAADDAKDDFSDLNLGLKKLDDQVEETTRTVAALRAEVAKTGDLGLVKDIAKQEARLKAFGRQRKSLIGDMFKSADVDSAGIGIAARIGPVIIKNLPAALSSGGGIGAAIGAPIVAGLGLYMASAASGAILAGAAVGTVAAGVKLAASDPRVQAAGKELSAAIGDQLKDAARPFIPATLHAIGIVRSGFIDLDDDLEAIFGRSAGYLEPLTRGLMGLAREAAPGLRKAVDAAAPVIDMIGRKLPELGGAIGYLFEMVADNAGSAARAIGLTFDVIEVGIKGLAKGLDWAGKAFMAVDLIAASFRGPKEMAMRADEYARAQNEAKEGTNEWADALKDLGVKAAGAAPQVESLTDELKRLSDSNVSAERAAIAFEEAIDEAAAAAKTGAKGINDNTKAGRENRTALLDLRDAAVANAEAIFKTTGSHDLATQATERGRKAFLTAADAMGVEKGEAKRLADQLFGIPKKVETKADFKPDNKGVSDWKRTLSGIPRSVFIRAEFDLINNSDVALALRLGRLAKGGPVVGNGPKGVDSQPYLLAPGEHVLSAEEVDRAGGHHAIEAWRRGLMGAASPQSAAVSSSGRGGAASFVINAAGASPLEQMFVSWAIGAFRRANIPLSVTG